MDPGTLIDDAAHDPVLLLGSPPPSGRDLDVLVRPNAIKALAEVLSEAGFYRQGNTWARFAECSADVVDLMETSELELEADQIDRLFAEAQPIAGFRFLLEPSSHHRLLLSARRAASDARLSPKRRATLVSIADQPTWLRAREIAPAWRAQTALRELEVALDGRTPNSWRLRALGTRAERYRPGAVIAMSGLDGSGKSTQAQALEQTLSTLGYPVVRVWTSVSAHPSLARVVAPARLLLRHRRESSDERQQRPAAGEDNDPLTHLREGNPLLQRMWVGFVAMINAWWVMRAVRPHLLRGRIVICDRYTLDSIVHLRYRYGADRHYRVHLGLLRLFSPTPLRAYLLDVSPETAYERNQEYTFEQIELRARLYREEHAGLDVRRLDGERPPEELCQQLALEVWSALREERDVAAPALMKPLGVLSCMRGR